MNLLSLKRCDFAVSCVSPAKMFTLKNEAQESMEVGGNKEEGDFKTDEEEEMVVDKQVQQKRKKVCRNLKSYFIVERM